MHTNVFFVFLAKLSIHGNGLMKLQLFGFLNLRNI